ncbi:hypothetical protein PGN_0983 [Porphyromonas gingivalis ATCC 33277]|uniref:Uncharacterized protein n=1 Tax=Porphyromonas gingivalis (strain ATCC 33277 / DSM 20709 / CIP 103683 / JCM 12257 / NCTC 11834 / 2561) TaxID=431947 RepID=B2RJF7_PORG3|nr:hypothetical protein PGN_0983 [Porphyromonas gingivalis ATCC 33277]
MSFIRKLFVILFYIKQINSSFEELHPLGGRFVGRQI